ncbi:MAG: ATP-binding protein [Polyangiaceae bacterium]
MALRAPWTGLRLESDFEGRTVRIVGNAVTTDGLPAKGTLVRVRGPSDAVDLVPTDLIEEPDYFDTYAEMATFFDRQSRIDRLLRSGDATFDIALPEGPTTSARANTTPRPLGSLPLVFWFQLVVGSAGFLISAWVYVLRPKDLGVRMFALMGLFFPMFTIPAAVYGARELAMDGTLFRVLGSLNHAGANLFGCALVGLFLVYPRRIVPTWALWLVPGVVVPWFFADAFRLAPNQDLGSRIPIMAEMLLAIVFAIVQWRKTKGDPRGRTALRTLGVAVLTGSSLFVFSTVGSSLFGLFPPLPQGYAFGFFLFMHGGLALGLRRDRLFELNQWSWRVLLWVVGALLVMALDALLLVVLEANHVVSSTLSLLVCAALYLPVRTWLWSKVVARRTLPEHELFEGVLEVTFARTDADRSARWKAFVERLFDPVEIRTTTDVPSARLGDDGLWLEIPQTASLPALHVAMPWRGRGLFGEAHVKTANDLVGLVRQAEDGREAFYRGVHEERHRIARDLHDDMGARLLHGLYVDDLVETRRTIREALGEMRSVVHELTGKTATVRELCDDMKTETSERFAAVGLAFTWSENLGTSDVLEPLSYKNARAANSMVRELVSNVIKHAKATRASVEASTTGGALRFTIVDDGVGFDATDLPEGTGLANLKKRASELGGETTFARVDGTTRATLTLPLR